MDKQYIVTDMHRGKKLVIDEYGCANKLVVDKYDVAEKMATWYDAPDADSAQAVADAIENIEDAMYGRLNEPMWACDYLGVSIGEVEDGDERVTHCVMEGYGRAVRCGDNVEYRIDYHAPAVETWDVFEARAVFDQMAAREQMRKSWDVEFSNSRSNRGLVYSVEMETNVEVWNADEQEWQYERTEDFDTRYYDIEDYLNDTDGDDE